MFRSPQLKCDLSGLSVNVGKSMITQSSKVRDLGIIFDQFPCPAIVHLTFTSLIFINDAQTLLAGFSEHSL